MFDVGDVDFQLFGQVGLELGNGARQGQDLGFQVVDAIVALDLVVPQANFLLQNIHKSPYILVLEVNRLDDLMDKQLPFGLRAFDVELVHFPLHVHNHLLDAKRDLILHLRVVVRVALHLLILL